MCSTIAPTITPTITVQFAVQFTVERFKHYIAPNGNTTDRLMQGIPKGMSKRRWRINGVPKGSLETDN